MKKLSAVATKPMRSSFSRLFAGSRCSMRAACSRTPCRACAALTAGENASWVKARTMSAVLLATTDLWRRLYVLAQALREPSHGVKYSTTQRENARGPHRGLPGLRHDRGEGQPDRGGPVAGTFVAVGQPILGGSGGGCRRRTGTPDDAPVQPDRGGDCAPPPPERGTGRDRGCETGSHRAAIGSGRAAARHGLDRIHAALPGPGGGGFSCRLSQGGNRTRAIGWLCGSGRRRLRPRHPHRRPPGSRI